MKFKKSLALIISVVMVFASFASFATAATTFSDISNHWGRPYIEALTEREIINGYTDGTFKPDGKITRAEFCTIITKSLIYDEIIEGLVTPTGVFNDVNTNAWYAAYVETAFELGLVSGKGEGIFDPNAFITRQEMAKIISIVYIVQNVVDPNDEEEVTAYTLGLLESFNEENYTLTDLGTEDTWATPFIQIALVAELMRGNSNNQFLPKGQVTRAETATVAFRLLELVLPSATPTTTEPVITDPPPTDPPSAIRSHGEQLTYANITRANYPNFIQDPVREMTILADGVASDIGDCITCDLDVPEYLFDFGLVEEIQSFALAGYNSSSQAVPFRLLISEDKESWLELGIDVDLRISEPIIEDKSVYVAENFDTADITGRMNPAPTQFNVETTNDIFTYGNFKERDLLDPFANERTVECFAVPQMDTTITTVDWQALGYVNYNCNYMFHYFMDDVQSAQYVKIIGYGNTSKQWYMFSSFTEVLVFGPDA